MSIRNRITQYLSSVLSSRIWFTTGPRLVGKSAVGAGYGGEITVGTGLTLSGGVLSASGGEVSDIAYNEATWNGVTTIAPSKNAVRDKLETLAGTIIDPTALTFAGIDPNGIYVTGTSLGVYEGQYAPDGSLRFVSEGGQCLFRSGSGPYGWFMGPTYSPVDAVYVIGTAVDSTLPPETGWLATIDSSPTDIVAASLTATHLGQWCKATTAWWQWDGSVWIPRNLLTGEPITTDGTNYYAITHDGSSLGYTPFP